MCRAWAAANPGKRRKSVEGWRQKNRPKVAEMNHDTKKRRRARARARLGTACACCGEDRDYVMDIDHIDGNGSLERRVFGRGYVYSDVLTMADPKSKYQLLCSNCNQAKRRLGYCPHSEESVRMAACP